MSGLTHAEWSALTDAASTGTDELLIEVAERIIAAREAQARREGAVEALEEAADRIPAHHGDAVLAAAFSARWLRRRAAAVSPEDGDA